MFGGKKKKAQNLMQHGSRAVGTITRVDDTGMTINDNPRVKINFRIEPLDGTPAFEGDKKTTVSRVQIPQIGARYPVWYDANDRSTFMFATINDESGRQQIAAMFGDAFGPDGSGVGMPAQAAAQPATGNGAADGDDGSAIDRIRELGELRKAGILSDEEFQAKKRELLREV